MDDKVASIPQTIVQEVTKMHALMTDNQVQFHKAFAGNPMVESIFDELFGCVSRVMSCVHDKAQILNPSHVDSPVSTAHDMLNKKRKVGPVPDRRGGSRRRSPTGFLRRAITKTLDDGQTWRKYGQKDIQTAKKPRSYFRCTHKNDQGCNARRQVQESEEDNSTYIITYFGEHTCKDPTKILHNIQMDHINYKDNNSCIISFENNAKNIVRPSSSITPSLTSLSSLKLDDYTDEEMLSSNLTTPTTTITTSPSPSPVLTTNDKQDLEANLGAMADNGDVTSAFQFGGDDNSLSVEYLNPYQFELDNLDQFYFFNGFS